MRRFLLLVAAILASVPGCVGSSSGGRSRAIAPPAGPAARKAPAVLALLPVPPPTQVQFFNGTNHGPVKVWKGMDGLGIQADLSFGVRDAAGNEDEYGLDDQTLLSDVNLGSNQSAEHLPILEPSHRPVAGQSNHYVDVDVDGNYKTISLTFTASVGGRYPGAPVHLAVPDPMEDDIINQTMKVYIEDIEGGVVPETRISVKVKYRDKDGVLHELLGETAVVHD